LSQAKSHVGTAHVLHWLKAEGSPRLALSLVKEELQRTGRPPVVISMLKEAENSIEPAFRELGVEVHYVGWNRDFGKLILRMNEAFKRIQPTGVICYSIGTHVSVAVAACWRGLKTLVHIGNAPPEEPGAVKKIKLQFQAGRPFVTKHIACSHFVRDISMKTYGLPGRYIVAVPNGIDLERFLTLRQQRQPRAEGTPIVIGMVASLEMHKDQETLIRSMAVLKQRGIAARLRLVGTGTKHDALQIMAREQGVFELIDWVGSVSDVRPELLKMDVFAYAVHPQEGLGIALVEAMAAGLPAVGADVGACQEVLNWGKYGTLIEDRNPQAWADSLVQAARQPAVSKEMLAQYDIRQTASAYFRELYDRERGPK
jgi:glycosyltransferase involved in cell wall biosynthesis